MKRTSIKELIAAIPGEPSDKWPEGEPYSVGLLNGTMSLGWYSPRGSDPQAPHEQDELYIVHSGKGEFECDGERVAFQAGDAFFVPAGAEHRFHQFSDDFQTWVIFWGPPGGEE